MRVERLKLLRLLIVFMIGLRSFFYEVAPQHVHTSSSSAQSPRFGVIEAFDAPHAATQLGAGWTRVQFHWARIQPDSPDQWVDPDMTIERLKEEVSTGRAVIGLMIGIPDWAQTQDGLPRGLYLASDDPDNLWGRFVEQTVSRHSDLIDHWIVWNEPDIFDENHPSHTWAGTVVDYVQLLKVAYTVAHSANPDAVVHMAAMSHWWDVQHNRELYFPRLLEAILDEPDAVAHNYFYDVTTSHLYFNPASVYEIIKDYDSYQQQSAINKPFWLVETNAAPSNDPAWSVSDPTFDVSLLEQAAYQPQAISLALAAGAERIAVFKMIDTPGDKAANPEPFGLVRADGTTRPAFKTTQTAFSILSDVESATWNEQHLTAQVVMLTPERTIRILWSRVPGAHIVALPALDDSAELVDMWGNSRRIASNNGTYEIQVFAGQCQETTGDYCMIGGPPVYLIEKGQIVEPLPEILSIEPMSPVVPQPIDNVIISGVGGLLTTGMLTMGTCILLLRTKKSTRVQKNTTKLNHN